MRHEVTASRCIAAWRQRHINLGDLITETKQTRLYVSDWRAGATGDIAGTQLEA